MPRKKYAVIRVRGGASVLCECGAASRVVYTRRTGVVVDRLRVCDDGHKFHTEEQRRKPGDRRRRAQGKREIAGEQTSD